MTAGFDQIASWSRRSRRIAEGVPIDELAGAMHAVISNHPDCDADRRHRYSEARLRQDLKRLAARDVDAWLRLTKSDVGSSFQGPQSKKAAQMGEAKRRGGAQSLGLDELAALCDAIDMTLALPDSIRDLLAQWLTPADAKPNGHDPHPLCPSRRPRPPPCRFSRLPRSPTRPSVITIPPTRGPSGSFSRRCASNRVSARLHWRRSSAQACRPPKRG
jgi:hypothetical protein